MRKLKRVFTILLVVIVACSYHNTEESTIKAEVKSEESSLNWQQETKRVRVKEIKELRNRKSKTYEMSDGSFQSILYSDDVHYKDLDGEYQIIDNSIISEDKQIGREKHTYQFRNSSNSYTARFSNNDSTYPVCVEYEGTSISFGLEGAKINQFRKNVLPKIKNAHQYFERNNVVMYQNVYPSIDLVYEADSNGIKEYIILNKPTNQNEFYFNIKLEGLTVKEGDEISFVNEEGDIKLKLGQLYAFDSNEAITEKVMCEVVTKNGEKQLKLTLDKEYLTNPERVFPIVIDPTTMITGETKTFDAFVSSKNPNANYQMDKYLRTGSDSSFSSRRTYIKFTIPTHIQHDSIKSAKLRLRKDSGATPNVKAYLVTSSWSSSSITWNNKPSYDNTTFCEMNYASNNWYEADVKYYVNKWLASKVTNYGFLLKDSTETGTSQWTTFYSSDAASPNKPELVIDHIYCGARPYEKWSAGNNTANCMGYALNVSQNFRTEDVGVYDKDLLGKNVNQLLNYFADKSRLWMVNNLPDLPSVISNYDSTITNGRYRVVLRVGLNDKNDNGIFDPDDNIRFHWWYQTDSGRWAEKQGQSESQYVKPTMYAIDNPQSVTWDTGYYTSSCKYFSIVAK